MEIKRCLFQIQKTYSMKALQVLILLGSFSLHVQAQVNQASEVLISGTVKDNTGEPLIGANVIEKGTTNGTITDLDGGFSLKVKPNAVIQVSYIGFNNKEFPLGGQTTFNIVLDDNSKLLQDVIVVGYGVQKKVTLTGAISAIKGDEILATRNENVQNMLAGRVAGLRVVQNSSEPGSFNNNFEIRGMGNPLLVIDGVPRDNISRLDPNDIESISVLKDASAAIYGVRAANGVVLVTTKKGSKDKLELRYSGNFGWQKPSGLPRGVGAVDYMTLANERSMHNVDGGKLSFQDKDFAPYLDGTLSSTDWYSPIIRDLAPQAQHNISATGGNDKATYYMSLGYQTQDGFLKSGDLNYNRYNIRSNVSSKITNRLTVDMNISGIAEEKNAPYISMEDIIRSFWRMKPTDPIYANNNEGYYMQGSVDGSNPVAMMNSDVAGYNKTRNKWFQTTGTATYIVPYIDGLKAKALFSYDYYLSDNKIYRQEYNQYTYNDADDTYKSFTHQAPNRIRRENFSRQSVLWNLSLDYNKNFNKKHDVGALLLLEQAVRQADNFYALRELALPIDELLAGNSANQEGNMKSSDLYKDANRALVGRFNYAYQSKYMAEFSFRYDGSSKFPTNYRWGFFPSASVGWRASEENFWKDSFLAFVNNFKLRGSYGKLGDDGAASYQFIQGYFYPATGDGIDSNKLPNGHIFDGNFITSMSSKGIANPNITWYTAKTANIGFDLEAWNGLFGVVLDLFQRDRDGLLARRVQSLPGIVGATLPEENLNSDRTRGFDLELTHRNKINDFRYSAMGVLSFARTMNRYQERAKAGNSYENWRNNNNNRWSNTWWGYGTTSQYDSWGSIVNSPTYVGRGTLPGDYAYQDWNGDGVISDLDKHPIAYGGDKPMMSFGLTLIGEYKGIDLNILLQGAAMSSVSYSEQLREPLWGGGSGLEQFMDRWHPVDPRANPYDPNIDWVSGYYAYTGSLPDTDSKYNMQDVTYVRLKSIELGYTLPASVVRRLGIQNVRVFTNGYNLLTVTNVKHVDPEHPSSSNGYLYPLNKTFSLGVDIKF